MYMCARTRVCIYIHAYPDSQIRRKHFLNVCYTLCQQNNNKIRCTIDKLQKKNTERNRICKRQIMSAGSV